MLNPRSLPAQSGERYPPRRSPPFHLGTAAKYSDRYRTLQPHQACKHRLHPLECQIYRSVAQPGSALAWGARGPEFESRHSDRQTPVIFRRAFVLSGISPPNRPVQRITGRTSCGLLQSPPTLAGARIEPLTISVCSNSSMGPIYAPDPVGLVSRFAGGCTETR